MRKSSLFLLYLAINITLLAILFGHSVHKQNAASGVLEEKREMVRQYQLTDLCLFTEASYTRHLSVADRHTPFQDGPMALEHFPSGSILAPPATNKKSVSGSVSVSVSASANKTITGMSLPADGFAQEGRQ
jgi:hypothetical protein